MRLRDPLADRESQSESTALGHSRSHSIGPPEPLENVWKVGGGYSDSRITNGECHVVRMPAQSELDFAAGRCVLDGVGDQVEKELAQTSAICHYSRVGGEREIDRYALSFTKYERRFVNLLHQRLELDRLPVQIEPSQSSMQGIAIG